MQRLFSTFADGWPGGGLLLLRILIGATLIYFAIGSIREGPPPLTLVLQSLSIVAAIFLLLGSMTPIAGILAAILKLWIAGLRFSSQAPGDPWIAVAQAVLAAALAMTGPGAWSIDARQFGRKHIDLSDR